MTFERYFKVREYQNRTQHEKIPPGSSLDFFRQVGSPKSSPDPPWGTPHLGVPPGSLPGEENYFNFKFPPRYTEFYVCYEKEKLTPEMATKVNFHSNFWANFGPLGGPRAPNMGPGTLGIDPKSNFFKIISTNSLGSPWAL